MSSTIPLDRFQQQSLCMLSIQFSSTKVYFCIVLDTMFPLQSRNLIGELPHVLTNVATPFPTSEFCTLMPFQLYNEFTGYVPLGKRVYGRVFPNGPPKDCIQELVEAGPLKIHTPCSKKRSSSCQLNLCRSIMVTFHNPSTGTDLTGMHRTQNSVSTLTCI